MVEYNGVTLESVAPVRIIDIALSPPAMTVAAQGHVLTDGARFIRRKRGERTVTITFALLTEDYATRRAQLAAITAWASSPVSAPLCIATEPGGYLQAVCTTYPSQSARQFWEVLTLAFTAYDPRFIDCAEYTLPASRPVIVAHNEPPAMRIEQDVSTPISNPSWALGAHKLQLSGSVGVGRLVIDFERQTITLNGQSIMNQLTIDSRFFIMKQGANAITCTGGAGGILYWRERWI